MNALRMIARASGESPGCRGPRGVILGFGHRQALEVSFLECCFGRVCGDSTITLVALAERAVFLVGRFFGLCLWSREIVRPLRSLRGDDDPFLRRWDLVVAGTQG